MSLGYRADIDGLRAVAVTLVLIFHFALVGKITAGFLGVDIFFVISGFLITSIIKAQIDDRAFALTDFYELADSADTHRLRVPWREDPRPVEGVLHGTYAHLALVQLCRSRGAAGRTDWLRYQAWVTGACQALWETKALTEDGERFVAGMLASAHADGPASG